MSFSEFQYSDRQAFPFTVPSGDSGETWTKEEAVSGIKFRDKVTTGRQLIVTMSNPQNIHGSKYSAFKRVRVIDRPSNAVLFIGRIVDAQNDHRKQLLTLVCLDYVADLSDKTVPSANLYGNRRSDITKDVISGGIEQGRTAGVGGSLDRILDSSKKFDKKYEGRVVKVAGRGPGLVTAYASNIITDSSATGIYNFDDSFINRLIRRVVFTTGRKRIEWEGRVTAVPVYLAGTANSHTVSEDSSPNVAGTSTTWIADMIGATFSYTTGTQESAIIISRLSDTTIVLGKAISGSGAYTIKGNQLTVSANGVDTRLSGGEDYSSTAHAFSSSASPAHHWEIVGYEGTITNVLTSTLVECSTVGSTSSASYAGYKDANFLGWGANTTGNGTVDGKLGGIDYVIESAEDGVFQFVAGQSHTSDKSIDWESRVDKSPYLEYIRKSYGQGQASSEGVRETLQKIATEEIWEVPQVLFFGGHLDSSLGVPENDWMLGSTEVNTGVDLLLKPTKASLPLQTRVTADVGDYSGNITVNNKVSGLSHVDIMFSLATTSHSDATVQNPGSGLLSSTHINSSDVGSPATVGGTPAGFWDPADPNKNMIQIGDEVRRVVGVSSSSIASVTVDTPFDNVYIYTDKVYVGMGPYVGSPRWEQTTHLGGAPTASQPITGKEDLIPNGTFYGDSAGEWISAPSGTSYGGFVEPVTGPPASITVANAHAYVTTDTTRDGLGALTTIVEGIEEGKTYRLTLEVARDITGGTTNRTANDADERKVWISNGAPSYLANAWHSNSYTILNSDNMVSSDVAFSTSNRDAWIQYHFEFVAPAGLTNDSTGTAKKIYVSLVAGTTANPVLSTLTADANSGQAVVNVTNGALFSVGDTVTVYDNSTVFAAGDRRTISSISTHQITLDSVLNFSYTTAASATLRKPVSGKKARFDSVQLRERVYDSRIYIGSPRIFNGIKFDVESSTDAYQGMSLEFWGRDRRDGTFGWHNLEDYHVDDAQTGDLRYYNSAAYGRTDDKIATTPNQAATVSIEGVRGIDDFNRSGTIKWWDIGFRDKYEEIEVSNEKYTPDWEWPPNTPWNHWPKDNLRNTEPVLGTKVNTLSTTKHNYSGVGGVPVTGLDDPEYSNLYWVRMSMPSNEATGIDDASIHPGFIKNLRVLDGRKSSRDETDTPLYDTTERSLSNAQWDWRVEDPGFFSVVGQVDVTSPSTTLSNSTTTSEAIVHASATTIDNSDVSSTSTIDSSNRLIVGAASVKVDPTTVSTTLNGAIAHTQTTTIDGAIGAASSDTTVVVDVNETKTTLNGAILHGIDTTLDGGIDNSVTSATVNPTTTRTTLIADIAHSHATLLNGQIDSSQQTLVVDSVAVSTNLSVGESLLINSEQMLITAVDTDTNTLTVDRGQHGTTAANHGNNQLVYYVRKFVNVVSSSGLDGATLKIGNEEVTVQSLYSATVLVVIRGQNGTSVAAHSDGDAVLGLPTTLINGVTILIDSEQMAVTAVNIVTYVIGITREVNGTSAVLHDNADNVYVLDTTIAVASNTNLATNQLVKVDSEFMQVTDRSSNTLTVKRGQNSSAVAAHSDSAPVVGIASAFTSATVLVGAEQMTVTGVNTATNTLTVTRQVNNTIEPSNNTHADGVAIYVLDTTIPVTDADASGLTVNAIAQVGTENMQVTAIDAVGNILTVVRGHGRSTVAAHANSGTAAEVRTGVPASLATGVTALIGTEQMTLGTVTAATSTIAIATRGANNTTAATHAETQPIYPLDVTVPVSSLLSMVVGSVIRIGSEDLQISSIAGLVLTVVRGHNSTAVADYSSGVAVSLLGDISAVATTMEVVSATNLTLGHVIKIGTEEMDITAISGTTLTVTRGFGNTTAATHSTTATVTSFHVWDDFTSDMTSLSRTASMEGFSTSFRGDNKYIYFGADYKFSGIEFNLKTNGTAVGPAEGLIAEYWNGIAWVAVQDLYSYNFTSSGSMRWDMDTIDFVEVQGSDYSSNYFESKYQWKKRDIRTSTTAWGGYDYDNTAVGAANATRNLYRPPSTTEVISSEVTQTASVINGEDGSGGPTGITQFNVDSSTNLRKGHWINIGDESMLITGISGNTLTVRRGQLGTKWSTSSGEQHPIDSLVKTVQPVGGAPFGDGTGAYPAGVGNVNSLNAPHNHLYWMRLRLEGAGSITTAAVITTIRMFSRPALKYFERGTEPWNFHLTGTEETTSATTIYGLPNKYEFNDSSGKFVRSPSSPDVNNSDAFIKNISAADYTYANSGVLSASRVGLQPALRQGGVGATGEATVVTTLNGAINNSSSTTTVVVDDAKDISVNDYILIDLERMMVTAKSANTLTVIRGVDAGGDFWGSPTGYLNVVLNANAASGQRVVAMASTTGFVVGHDVRIYDNDTPAGETKEIASLTSTQITLNADLANAYTTAASAGILRTEPTDTAKNYFTSVEANHAHESDVSVLPRTTDLHERLHLSAGIFVPGFTATDYQGATGSKYLFYQDKLAGVKSYDVYGGDTSSTGNWHGLRISHGSSKTNQNIPLYRYSISEVPANIVTRVTVNGEAPITFTAIDEESETLYGVKKERVIYDRTIKSKTEAESKAENVLTSSKPTTTQTVKQATLEFYDFPVYSYNSATTSSVDRDIPRVLRAGDIIQVTINDGNYNIINAPFLVQGLDYDDGKSLTKLSCTEGISPTTTNMFNISDTTYAAAIAARNTAQSLAVPSGSADTSVGLYKDGTSEGAAAKIGVTNTSEGKTDDGASNDTNNALVAEESIVISENTYSGEAVESYIQADLLGTNSPGFDGKYLNVMGIHQNQGGATTQIGDTEDISLSGTDAPTSDSDTDLIVLSKTSLFVARDGGFTPGENWRGRTVVLNAGATNETTYTITEVKDVASIKVDGGYTWTTSDAPVIRKISSAIKNPLISDLGATTYFDLDRREIRSRTGTQIISPSNTDSPVWGTNFVGWHGTKATNSSGLVYIDLYADHGVGQLLTHKPIVIATVDPTDLSGDENTGAVQAAYVVVQKYTNWGDTPVLAQTGYAATGSAGDTLVAQAGNTTVSKFAAGLSYAVFPNASIGDTVFQIDSNTSKILKSGTVASVTNDTTLVTSGINNWASGNRYVIHAQIRYIWLKVYYPSLQLDAVAAGATQQVLINTVGTQLYTSHGVDRAVSITTPAGAGIGVHYMIIPKAHRKDHLPFDHDNGSGTFGHGNDF